MLVESLCQAIAYLFQVEIAKCRSHLLRVKTMAQVPSLVTISLLDQWVPGITFRLTVYVLWRCSASGELLIKQLSLAGHSCLLLGPQRISCSLGLSLLRGCSDRAVLLLIYVLRRPHYSIVNALVLRWPYNSFISACLLRGPNDSIICILLLRRRRPHNTSINVLVGARAL